MKQYTVDQLKEIAMEDQVDDWERPWNYTDNCHVCGGVKSFLDWLEDLEETTELPLANRFLYFNEASPEIEKLAQKICEIVWGAEAKANKLGISREAFISHEVRHCLYGYFLALTKKHCPNWDDIATDQVLNPVLNGDY